MAREDEKKDKQSPTVSEKNSTHAEKKKRKQNRVRGTSSGAEPSQEQINRLLTHYQSKMFTEAEQLAQKLTQEFPNHSFGWKVLGAIFNQTGRLSESLLPLKKSVELSTRDAEAHSNLANTLKALGRLNEAETSYRRALALKPSSAEVHYNLANVLTALDRTIDAEAHYRHAIAFKPDFFKGYYNLGNALRSQGRLIEAEANYRQAVALKPDSADAHNNLAGTLGDLGRLDEAEANYRQAIALNPNLAKAHFNLGNTVKKLGRLDEAEASFRKTIALEPDNGQAAHMLAALTGEATSASPLDFVEELFDDYAATFDSSLVGKLGYQTPKIIADMMKQHYRCDTLGSVLDLGCGTGLFGVEIADVSARIDGVDISEKMLKKARGKGVYNRLIKQDIVAYLSTESLDFDCFVATDVFVYMGDLSEVFQLIKSRNRSSGQLAFSTEHIKGDGYTLQRSGRYAHSKAYIETLCYANRYQLQHFETQDLRKENNNYLSGGLYLLTF